MWHGLWATMNSRRKGLRQNLCGHKILALAKGEDSINHTVSIGTGRESVQTDWSVQNNAAV